MTVVEVMAYGDFSMPYTHSVFYTEQDDAPIPNQTLYSHDESPDRLIQDLKSMGFKRLRTKTITVGGSL